MRKRVSQGINGPVSSSTPFEIREFESLLGRPAADPAGLAGFFHSADIHVSRVPARLDVMGGIADYSGANVCEATLGRGMLVALQPRTDRTLRIRTLQAGRGGLPVETRVPMDLLFPGGEPCSYEAARELCHANPLASWSAYIAGSIFTLLKEEGVTMDFGFSLVLLSAVPMNVGIGSSAAVEVGTLSCLNSYLGLGLDGPRLARLGQMAENLVVGAPCGIMDQTAIACGSEGKLTHILCRPGEVMGSVEIPAGTGFIGINSMVRHSVAGSPYADTRIGAFMGRRIINEARAFSGRSPLQHLAELPVEEFRADCEPLLPATMRGAEFLSRHGAHDDAVTVVQPDATYRVAGPTRHPVEENARVLRFMDCLRRAEKDGEAALVEAGGLMFESHESYRSNCLLSVAEVDFLVDTVRKRWPSSGLYGAKITGGGTGGTVAVFGRIDALREHAPQIAAEYARRVGVNPDVFEGTSAGAVEFGGRRYRFGPSGWMRVAS